MSQGTVIDDFQLYKLSRRGHGANHRINKNAIHHLVTNLLPYYPQLGVMKAGERADFIIFLFEKALKEKMTGYKTSWECAQMEKGRNESPIF